MRQRTALVLSTLAACALALPSLGAAAAPYPPPTYGLGRVDRSVVHPGECVHFYGGGFAPRARLSVTDNGRATAKGKADKDGNFVIRVCFSTDATLGPHELAAVGTGFNTAERTVTAEVTVLGISESGESTAGGMVDTGGGGVHAVGRGPVQTRAPEGALPFTGADIARMLAAALALLVGGILITEQAHRRRRRPGS